MQKCLEAPLYDKDCVLGNILAAHYLISSDISRAKTYARAAEYHLVSSASVNERFSVATTWESHFEAVNYLISDNMEEDKALELHSKLLNKFPKDLLAWKRVEILCFYMGRPDLSLPLFEKILPENREQDYVYGMLAFPLLELGHITEAEKAARKGYEINKNDSWAHHCLCHVLQTACRFKEAVEFMSGCSASWDSCSSLRYSHNWWHVAVCYLEGGSPMSKVQEIYDNQMCKELEKEDAVASDVYMDALAIKVLERRIKQRNGAPFLWEKSYLMEGDAEAVVTTCEKANVLESSYFKFA
ncbi:unnamed protein product [Eruca vesicaria subsp. sativa]|uniref:Tetratricopeptide repeat protein 38 n=1 Tax=Eruca vesicaria subsp. sativa TaxID=29727 RepID=A0ABC8M3R0_ERUVS|nr:unnamed protein product [Eruca vesicaria subsp. sativa]